MLCTGADFYSTPQLSADGRLAWTQWDHPNMPWDSTTIMIATLAGRSLVDSQCRGRRARRVGRTPALAPGGELIFASDRTNWWNLYAWRDGETRALHETAAEFCGPQWVFGQTPYAVIDDDHLLCTLNRGTVLSVAVLSVITGELEPVTEPGVGASALAAGGGTAAAVLSYPDRPGSLAILDLDRRSWQEIRRVAPSHHARGCSLAGATGQLAERARPRPRLVLSPGQPGVHRTRRDAATADHPLARRPDRRAASPTSRSATSSGPPVATRSWT